jgi:hypothetical protein
MLLSSVEGEKNMTVEEIRAAIQAKGWTYRPKTRRQREFVYAVRRNGAKLDEKYLGAMDNPNLLAKIEALPSSGPATVAQQQQEREPGAQIDASSCNSPEVVARPHNGKPSPESPHSTQRVVARPHNGGPTPESPQDQVPSPEHIRQAARECAKDLIRVYVERGDTLNQITQGHMGRFSSEYEVQIGATVYFPKKRTYTRWQIVVLKVLGKDCLEVFDARELYAEIQKECQAKQQPALEICDNKSQDQALNLTIYSRNTLGQGPHDQARRTQLAQWAEAHQHPVVWYTTHYEHNRCCQTELPGGKASWTHFLAHATPYDIYCCYIAACATRPLLYYIKNAHKRGEISSIRGKPLDEALPNTESPRQDKHGEVITQSGNDAKTQGQALDLDSLIIYNPDTLQYRGEQDQARRTALARRAEKHQYRTLRFVSYYKGIYRQPIAAFNKEQWNQFLAQAGARDIYYAFVAAYAPRSLQYYIEGKELTAPEILDELEDQALDLIAYTRNSMRYQGPEDLARRASLMRWAEQHGYKGFWYRCGKYGNDHHYQSGVPEGKEGWISFLEKAVGYDIYCCYIAAFAPQPLQHYLNDAIMRGEITNLADDAAWQPNDQEPEQRAPAIHNEPPDQALDLITYSRDNLKYQGPHDQARRAQLRQWAEQHGYKPFWFTRHAKYGGYSSRAGVPGGKEGWTHFLEKAVQYDVYCCYIAAYAPEPLKYYLEDAAKRGEIQIFHDHLLWRPGQP